MGARRARPKDNKAAADTHEARMFPLAFSYLRFSSPEQEEGDSFDRQTGLADAWAARSGVTLDRTFNLLDPGVSGYCGVSRTDPDRYALAKFLKGIETGRVRRGDYLLIENLDRLSREEEVPATHLLTSILMSGVVVVQLSPYELTLTEKSDGFSVMRAVMELSRGHGESLIKSKRMLSAHAKRREAAVRGERALTGRLPGWLELGPDRLPRLIPERAAVVKRIFQLAAGGHGILKIIQRLEAEGVQAFGRRVPLADREGKPRLSLGGKQRHRAVGKGVLFGSGKWTVAYVAAILKDRRAVGELQPLDKKGVPIGPPVRLPAAVTEEEWLAARAGCSERSVRRGRVGKHINLFSHLLRDARTRSTCVVKLFNPRKNGGTRALVSRDAAEGRASCVSFPYATFEEAVLKLFKEIDPADVLAGADGPDDCAVLSGRLAEVRGQREQLEAELLEGAAVPKAAVRVLGQLEERERQLEETLREARQKAANPLSEAWGQAQTLLGVAVEEEARLRLRSLLRQIVSEAWLLAVPRGLDRLAAVQIWFAGGEHRDYLIVHRPPLRTPQFRRPGGWWARSLADAAALGDLDLRKPTDAKKLEAALAALDLGAAAGE
jgi:DNA invertase Pin-like site-specific DNA recombinase